MSAWSFVTRARRERCRVATIQMKRAVAPGPSELIRISVGLVILVAFPAQIVHSGITTIKTPGPYPYETPGQVPAPPPPVLDSSPVPSPAPFPYNESSSPPATQDHDSRTPARRHPLTAKAVREAAFRYNGVSNFCAFLAALPANVSVYDPKLGRSRALVESGHVNRKNVVWLRKHKQAAEHK